MAELGKEAAARSTATLQASLGMREMRIKRGQGDQSQ